LNIYIGADHRGFVLKGKIKKFLADRGYHVVDVGTYERDVSCDYPKTALQVAKKVACDKQARGIIVCMSGIGNSIVANKVKGIRAALCYNKTAARLSREHNDANVLALGSKFVTKKELYAIITIWLKTPFEGGRHLRRVNQIRSIERGLC